jgi:hypothetical protein
MYSLIWQSVMWRPGKGWIPHWREDILPYPVGHDSQTVRS